MAKRDVEIGRNLTRLRGEMSQQALADEMKNRDHKWSQSTVWSVERGDRPIRLTEAADLADIFGAKIDVLIQSSLEVGLNRFINRLSVRFETARAELEYAAVVYNHWRDVLIANVDQPVFAPGLMISEDTRQILKGQAEATAAQVIEGDLEEAEARYKAEQYGYDVRLDANSYFENLLGEKVDVDDDHDAD